MLLNGPQTNYLIISRVVPFKVQQHSEILPQTRNFTLKVCDLLTKQCSKWTSASYKEKKDIFLDYILLYFSISSHIYIGVMKSCTS